MEWIEGCKLTDVAAMRGMRIHPRDVAIDMLHAFAQMTFVDGFGARTVLAQLLVLAHGADWFRCKPAAAAAR